MASKIHFNYAITSLQYAASSLDQPDSLYRSHHSRKHDRKLCFNVMFNTSIIPMYAEKRGIIVQELIYKKGECTEMRAEDPPGVLLC